MSSTAVSFGADLKSARVSVAEDPSLKAAAAAGSASSEAMLAELEIELAEKMSQMRALAERLSMRLESNFKCEVLKLPKAVRTMTMREFCVQHGGDIDEAMQQQAKRSRPNDAGLDAALMPPPPPMAAANAAAAAAAERAAAAKAAAKPTAAKGKGKAKASADGAAATPSGGLRSTRSRLGGVAATPSGGGAAASAKGLTTPAPGGIPAVAFTPRVHETPRNMRGGEVLLSANGSPINAIGTVRARVGKRGRSSTSGGAAAGPVATEPSVTLTMADGSELDLGAAASTAALADTEARATAIDHLQKLQQQVEAHIKALRSGNVQETLGGHIM